MANKKMLVFHDSRIESALEKNRHKLEGRSKSVREKIEDINLLADCLFEIGISSSFDFRINFQLGESEAHTLLSYRKSEYGGSLLVHGDGYMDIENAASFVVEEVHDHLPEFIEWLANGQKEE